MSTKASVESALVAVLGNPNTGKSTLFNALTGANQRTGNYPGVTVERREGRLKVGGTSLQLVDLPGTYSLAPRSPDEMVTVQTLLGNTERRRPPDLILCVVDASNLSRNLFLVSQLLDLNLPLVVALNMVDVATKRGLEIDVSAMSRLLGVPVIPVQAHKRIGLEALKQQLSQTINQPPQIPHDPFSKHVNATITRLHNACPDDCHLKRFVVTRLLFDADGFMTSRLKNIVGPQVVDSLPSEQRELAQTSGVSLAEQESQARYQWIKSNLDLFLRRPVASQTTKTARADQVLTHPIWGLAIVAVVMAVLFQLVFFMAEPASAAIDWGKGLLGTAVTQIVPAGAFQSLLVDGIIEGVGSVLVFLPQIVTLFLILAILEDSGYLARASFLMDRHLSRLGLSGVALIPLLSSFACAIPGVMATRVITNPRERLLTILIAPLMSCSARLPVYILLIAAFVPNWTWAYGLIGLKGLVMLAMYLVGIVTAIGVAAVLRWWLIPGGSQSFFIELPTYKRPQVSALVRRMWEGGWSFVRDAGTLIIAVTILVWAAAYYPRSESILPPELMAQVDVLQLDYDRSVQDQLPPELIEERLAEKLAVENRIQALHLENSYLGRAGRWIEPVVRPLGWDWRIGSAVIASFPAREVVVGTMGVIFGLGGEEDEESEGLQQALRNATWSGTNRPLFTLPVALGLMVFFALCAQCVSTLAVIRRETNSWWWPTVTFVYMTVLAYVATWLVYQVGTYWI